MGGGGANGGCLGKKGGVRRLVDKQREVLRQTLPVGNGSKEPAEIQGGELRKRGKAQGRAPAGAVDETSPVRVE